MILYCANCDKGPITLSSIEEMEKTRCTSCGVYMHDAIVEEDSDEEYCHGCESGVDCSSAHTQKCQQKMQQSGFSKHHQPTQLYPS
jgi:hypothetical protein